MVLGAAAIALAQWELRGYGAHAKTAEGILAKADELSWNNRWMSAAPLYAEAEQLFIRQNQPEKALYAHVSQFVPLAESEPIPALLLELKRDLSLPAAQAPDTRLRILVIEGMIETNYDAGFARKTWEQVEALAERRAQLRLAARAMGEQGIADLLLGDFGNAKKLVLRAWIAARGLRDPAALRSICQPLRRRAR